MSKTIRFIIILTFIALTIYCLKPSYDYYFKYNDKIREWVEANQTKKDTISLSPSEVNDSIQAEKLKSSVIKLGLDLKGGLNIVLEADFNKMAKLMNKKVSEITEEEQVEAIETVINKIRNRVDSAGVSEIIIRKQTGNRINVQIPGETNFDRIESIVSTTGNLTFNLVQEEQSQKVLPFYDLSEKIVTNQTFLSNEEEIVFSYRRTGEKKIREKYLPIVVEKLPILTGDNLTDSRSTFDEYNSPVVSFSFDGKGAPILAAVSSTNIGRRMAILLDGKVMSAPSFEGSIPNGQGIIRGNFTTEEAKDLALILKSGSLPVPIQIISKDIIGPKIGEKIRSQGLNALLYAIISIIIFIIFRYRFSGIIASIALILNAFMIIAFLSSFGLVISLAGIAGLILTIGMSIDANVIIFERIREELKENNYQVIEAVEKGYAKAFWAIFDSNLTTLIAAFVLFYYSSGVLQGFATTLFIGVIVSMFTSLFVTRFIFDFLIDFRMIKKYNKVIL